MLENITLEDLYNKTIGHEIKLERDDMDVFDGDDQASIQARKDGYKFLSLTREGWAFLYKNVDEVSSRNVLDTENNREIFKGMFKEKVMETKNDFEIGD